MAQRNCHLGVQPITELAKMAMTENKEEAEAGTLPYAYESVKIEIMSHVEMVIFKYDEDYH